MKKDDVLQKSYLQFGKVADLDSDFGRSLS
jgi:hypothetical protein